MHTGAVKFLDTISPKITGYYDYSLQNGYKYLDKYGRNPWTVSGPDKKELPCSIAQVIAEIHLTFQCIHTRGFFIPESLKRPRDKLLRATAADEGYEDYGNMIWEAMFWSARFYYFFGDSVQHCGDMRACPNDQYGTAANQSSHAPVNMRGNILETLLSFLSKKMKEERSKTSTRRLRC